MIFKYHGSVLVNSPLCHFHQFWTLKLVEKFGISLFRRRSFMYEVFIWISFRSSFQVNRLDYYAPWWARSNEKWVKYCHKFVCRYSSTLCILRSTCGMKWRDWCVGCGKYSTGGIYFLITLISCELKSSSSIWNYYVFRAFIVCTNPG